MSRNGGVSSESRTDRGGLMRSRDKPRSTALCVAPAVGLCLDWSQTSSAAGERLEPQRKQGVEFLAVRLMGVIQERSDCVLELSKGGVVP